jgi:hypothetical protein
MSSCILNALVLTASLLFGTGCSVDEDPSESSQPQACAADSWDGSLQIGGGEACFVALQQGQTVPLIAGPQGGFHLWMGIRCRNCGQNQVVTFGVKDVDGNFTVGQSLSASLTLDEVGDYRHTAGVQAAMPGDGFADPAYLGDSFTIWLEMQIDGQTVSDEVTVVVDGIEQQPSSCADCN